MAAVPIWKDYFVNLGTGDSAQYRVILDETDEVIYSGKAFKKPGETNIYIRINEICADYLENQLPSLPHTILSIPLSVTIQALVSDTWTDKDSVQFLNDWSYIYDYDPDTMGFAFPINGHLDSRMPLVWTGVGSSVNATLVMGGHFNGDYNNDFNNDFLIGGSSGGSQTIEVSLVGGGEDLVGTAFFYPAEYPGVIGVEIDGVTYEVVTECAEYALYYVNAFGGWDCFLIEGNTLEADSLKRFTREAVYDNRDIRNRGRYNYVNEINKGFTFQTGWLLDDQGKRMYHLINSTCVYLYDIANDQMIPVTIPTTSCEYKTYKNQGNKLVNYTIQVEIAQNRIRR